MVTRAPSCAARIAAGYPPGPPPITNTSVSFEESNVTATVPPHEVSHANCDGTVYRDWPVHVDYWAYDM